MFGVAEATFNAWKKAHPEFFEELRNGRALADSKVVASLYQRALGYSHDAVKIFNVDGSPMVVPYVEHYPPDAVACIFWLKNRQPALWREKADVHHTGKLEVPGLPNDVLTIMRKLAKQRADAAKAAHK